MDQLFPRDLYGRIALALVSLLFGPIFPVAAFALLTEARPRSVLEALLIATAAELCVALALFFACGLLWALATPRWLERLLEAVVKKFAIALGLFMLSCVILMAWALIVG